MGGSTEPHVSIVDLAALRGHEVPLKLASAATPDVTSRFCARRGASARRYVVTVFAVAPGHAGGLPEFDECVVLAIGTTGAGRVVRDVAQVERSSDRGRIAACGLARGAVEWHVHFGGDSRTARAEIVADLLARHGGAGQIEGRVARCA